MVAVSQPATAELVVNGTPAPVVAEVVAPAIVAPVVVPAIVKKIDETPQMVPAPASIA